ncbi:unnamed protein product (macronuclear) [Paramecium tetraurelia]|uniref:Protein kinase domain-containing protein n=1 Tax=Paramecium tetraurelia TaxID=5888 RepID=A0CAE9_PARTE|nr:uncharacterized protein GSPATT00036546001 [Paramecium tetraurelia]CAK67766.1 unnamed protein product [Paramecium tetraurelia]|eukprot:XP_001435163.1 hypothetical protein (macronuclear) [Paramecium tetraurelia strain d4-2]
MNQQFLVVEASLIDRLFDKAEILSRGNDLIHGISSIIYRMTTNKKNKWLKLFDKGGNYALQIYENINRQVFETKVLQLQKAMTLHLNPYSTRIILIAKEQLNYTKFNLHVVYELQHVDLDSKSIKEQREGLNQKEAVALLSLLCQNYVLGAQYTNEFLDISPQNIFRNGNSYIVSNFGINFAGTKFDRIYLPKTDPIYQEKVPSQKNILYSYAFRAALVTLCQMTQIDPLDLFYLDGQFKSELLDNLLYLITKKEDNDKKKDKRFIRSIDKFFNEKLIHTKGQDYNEQLKKNFGKSFEYERSDRILKYKYNKEFIDIFKKLLNVTHIQSRAIFPLLVSQPDNRLGVQNSYDEQFYYLNNYMNGTFDNKVLDGCGIVSSDQEGQGKNKGRITQKCGQFSKGKEFGEYNIINIHKKFECTLYNLQCGLTFRYVNWEMLYLVEDVVAPINPIDKSPKESIYIFQGTIENGNLKEGLSHQLDNTIFKGKFQNNQPYEGKMNYQNQNNDVFEGIMEGFNRKNGLFTTKDFTFEGQFQNDQFLNGLLEDKDGGKFYGHFNNGLKVKSGIYYYPQSSIQYQGLYANDKRHGLGKFIDKSQENCIQEVIYNNGKCESKLNEHFSKALKERKTTKLKTIG